MNHRFPLEALLNLQSPVFSRLSYRHGAVSIPWTGTRLPRQIKQSFLRIDTAWVDSRHQAEKASKFRSHPMHQVTTKRYTPAHIPAPTLFYVTNCPFLSVRQILASVPELKLRSSVSIPSLKMTPFSGISETRINGSFCVILPKVIPTDEALLGQGSLTNKYS